MENLTKSNEWSVELSHFQAEELEERLENCWKGEKKEWKEYERDDCTTVREQVVVPC